MAKKNSLEIPILVVKMMVKNHRADDDGDRVVNQEGVVKGCA